MFCVLVKKHLPISTLLTVLEQKPKFVIISLVISSLYHSEILHTGMLCSLSGTTQMTKTWNSFEGSREHSHLRGDLLVSGHQKVRRDALSSWIFLPWKFQFRYLTTMSVYSHFCLSEESLLWQTLKGDYLGLSPFQSCSPQSLPFHPTNGET